MEQQTGTGEPQQAAYCNWHPNVETGLSCSQCGRSICTQCLVQASVGIRCPECGKATPLPTFDVQPSFYAKAAGVGVAVAIGGGVLWIIFNAIFASFGGILSSIPALGVGYAAGEFISKSVNAKRSKGLAYIAAGSVIGAYLISLPSAPPTGFIGLIVLAIAIYTAVQRVK